MSTKQPSKNQQPSAGGQSITRSMAIVAITRDWLVSTGTAVQKFSEALTEAYCAAIPETMRHLPLRVPPLHGDADDYYRQLSSNTKAVQRYLEGAVSMPSDLEECWVRVLPEPWRERLVFELCARFGVLPVRVGDETDIAALAELMRDEAAMIEAMAPILADGKIDDADKEEAKTAIPRVKKAMAACAGLLSRLEAITGGDSLQVVGRP